MLPQTILLGASLLLSLATAAPTVPPTERSIHTDLTCVTEGGSSFWLGDVATACPAAAGPGIGPEQVQVCCTQPDGSNPCKRTVDGGCNGSAAAPAVVDSSTPTVSSQSAPSSAPTSVLGVKALAVKPQSSSESSSAANGPTSTEQQTTSTTALQPTSKADGTLALVFGGAKTGTGYPSNPVFEFGGANAGQCVVADQGNDAAFSAATYSGGDATVYTDDPTHAACITPPGVVAHDGSTIAPPADGLYVAVSYCLMDRVPSANKQPSMTTMCNRRIQVNAPGKESQIAVVLDKCAGCFNSNSLDMSPNLWAKFFSGDPNRYSGVTWSWLDGFDPQSMP